MALTYDSLYTFSTTSVTNTVTFSSITGAYTDLVIVSDNMKSVDGTGTYLRMRFNGDTGNNYSTLISGGNGVTSPPTAFFNSGARGDINLDYYSAPNTSVGLRRIDIFSYSNTNINKILLYQAGTSGGMDLGLGRWRNNSAISTIEFQNVSTNFAIGTRFTIYGILRA